MIPLFSLCFLAPHYSPQTFPYSDPGSASFNSEDCPECVSLSGSLSGGFLSHTRSAASEHVCLFYFIPLTFCLLKSTTCLKPCVMANMEVEKKVLSAYFTRNMSGPHVCTCRKHRVVASAHLLRLQPETPALPQPASLWLQPLSI